MSSQPIHSPVWICSQIGAREHFAIPRALHQNGRLAAFYTDFWAGPILRKLAAKTDVSPLRSLASRFHLELVGAPVRSWNWRTFVETRRVVSRKHKLSGGQYDGFIEIGSGFAVRVREALKRRSDLGEGLIFFAYDTGALEALEWCREHGVKCILNQMDPNRVEVGLVRAEEKQWPGWALEDTEAPEAYFARREQEWALADRVVVNSEFCREALMKQGVTPGKMVVVPLCYEPDVKNRKSKIENRKSGEPLRVLFLGQVILRKGIQYLMQVARLLEKENIQFDVVGPVGISQSAVKSAPLNMIFHGRATRDESSAWYRQSDLFVLPTLSDGFAITQLEAMAHGLPVVTTPCCGEVVSDGVDGFIVPPRDADSLARVFLRYLAEPELLKVQQSAALVKSRQFSLKRLAENLIRLEAGLI